MKEKRRDSKGRILHTGESQRTDGKYLYKYVDAFGNTKYVYAWRLTPTDPTPKGKREKPSLRELEQQKTEIENTEIVELVRSMKMNTSELSTFLKAYREKTDAPILMPTTQEDNHHEEN